MEKIDKIHFEIMLLANREDDKFKNELYKLLENYKKAIASECLKLIKNDDLAIFWIKEQFNINK